MKRVQLVGLDFKTLVAIVQAHGGLDRQSTCVWYDDEAQNSWL